MKYSAQDKAINERAFLLWHYVAIVYIHPAHFQFQKGEPPCILMYTITNVHYNIGKEIKNLFTI